MDDQILLARGGGGTLETEQGDGRIGAKVDVDL